MPFGRTGGGRTKLPWLLSWPQDHSQNLDSSLGLILAVCDGRADLVKLLLDAPEHAARADTACGWALVRSDAYKFSRDALEDIMHGEFGEHGGASIGNCSRGHALFLGVNRGHTDIVHMLLNASQHAAQADCSEGWALMVAVVRGRTEMVRMLLNAPQHAAHADCRDGQALIDAARRGHTEIVRILLDAPQHAAHADCRGKEALIDAAREGHAEIVGMLLNAPQHPALADGRAVIQAANNGHIEVVRVLLNGPQHVYDASDDADELADFLRGKRVCTHVRCGRRPHGGGALAVECPRPSCTC
eukprot:gene20138-biopygen28957